MSEKNEINMKNITINDCIELLERKDISVIINDGEIIGFEKNLTE